MTGKRSFLLIASFALSAVLVAVLIKVGKIDLRSTSQQLLNFNRSAFAKLLLLTGLNVYLSNLKWRKLDAFLRKPSDSATSNATSFAFTSAGVAMGQILPVQISMATARTLGTHVYGSALKRGTAGTLFEQSFDVIIVCFLAVASGVTWFYKGGATMWIASAIALIALALAAVGPAIRAARWLASYFESSDKMTLHNRILRRFVKLWQSGFLNTGLARWLLALSTARFVVQALMAGVVAEAVGANIPLWKLAAAMPFVTLAFALALTPGGLGVNELSYAIVLNMFGIPVAAGAQWALENRILTVASCFVVAGCGAAILLAGKVGTSSARNRVRD